MAELVEHGQLFIGGELTDPRGTDVIEVISPHTQEVIGRVPHASREDVDAAVAAARTAFDEGPWPRMSLDERIEVVTRIKDAIAIRHEEIARVISSENGSPYSWSVLAQALGAMMVWDSAITVARNFTYEETRDGVLGRILVRREPVGVVAAVVPWNVPQFVAAAKLARRGSGRTAAGGESQAAQGNAAVLRTAGTVRGYHCGTRRHAVCRRRRYRRR